MDRGDLTTDAIPRPPRGDPDAILRDEPIKEKDIFEENDAEKTHRLPKYPVGGKTKNNYRKPPRTRFPECDKVIYINNSKDVHIGSSTSYSINVGSPPPKASPIIYHQTQQIKQLLASNDAVTTDHLVFLSENISPSNWKFMARKLGFTDGRIEQFNVDHHVYGTREVIYQCLLEWIQSKPDDALVSRLTDVLWGSGEQETVDRFSQYIYPQSNST